MTVVHCPKCGEPVPWKYWAACQCGHVLHASDAKAGSEQDQTVREVPATLAKTDTRSFWIRRKCYIAYLLLISLCIVLSASHGVSRLNGGLQLAVAVILGGWFWLPLGKFARQADEELNETHLVNRAAEERERSRSSDA